MIIEFFESELEEAWKKGYCLIHRSERCKHLIKWRIEREMNQPFTKKRLSRSKGHIQNRKAHCELVAGIIKGVDKIKSTPEEKEMDKERERSKIGFGVQTWDGFVGSYRVK